QRQLPEGDLTLADDAAVDDETWHRPLDVLHLDQRAAGQSDKAVVGDLAAGLGVERRPVQDQLDLATGRRYGHPHTGDEQALYGRLARDLGVTGELGRACGVDEAPVGRDVGAADLLVVRVLLGRL